MKDSIQGKVKLLPGELTDEELEEVVGGRSDGAFQEWRVKIVNNSLHRLYDSEKERSRTARQPGVITESVSPPKK